MATRQFAQPQRGTLWIEPFVADLVVMRGAVALVAARETLTARR